MKKHMDKILVTILVMLLLIAWAVSQIVKRVPQYRKYRYLLYALELGLGALILAARKRKNKKK